MRSFLLAPTLLLSFSSFAQFKIDVVAAGGLTMPKLHEDRAPRSSARPGDYFATGIDFLFGTSHKLFPYGGVRLSHHGFHYSEEFAKGNVKRSVSMLALSSVAGIQYKQPLDEHMALRLAAGAGGFINAENMTNESGITAVAEASAGLQWRALTLGVKLIKPWSAYRQKHLFGQSVQLVKGEGFNDYTLHSVALELKLTPRPPSGLSVREPRPLVRRGPRGYESAKEHNARMELGIAAGPAFVDVTDRGALDNNPAGSGAIALVTFDVYGDGNKRPVCFAAGSRIGVAPIGAHIINVMGFQINTAPARDLGFRLSAMGGPLIYGNKGSFIKFNLVLESTASVLINHRWSLGVKYMQPIEELNDFYYRTPERGSYYRMRYLMGEVKLRFGKR